MLVSRIVMGWPAERLYWEVEGGWKNLVEELILLEQFITVIPDGLAIWLKEKKPKSLYQAAELADTPCKGR